MPETVNKKTCLCILFAIGGCLFLLLFLDSHYKTIK